MIKNTIIVLTFLLGYFSFAQKTKTYENSSYSINVPEGWKATNDNEIVNIFPVNEIGAITISEYHDLAIPKEEIKKFVLALYKSNDDESKVKTNKGKKGYTEYYYEYFDEQEKLFWITRVFQKDKELFLITINCGQKYWNGNYMNLFNETFNSFKIKK
ncbi:hypothetical protein IQ37_12970 [Chryseobacterium piperi]|uniref:PsbP C-terminal domain-containing protein n=1 Tax=Chryseobacterium piperi TaxID=558152 RepID=A0A086B7V5_9FLAO|nr:hypothetical protein [Chryseobacterium piperi]ASW74103.1 hypothetical protein CJF12_07235 [Chryseobacterium piperi]KFF25019.1 hypothetical protein IQ37_12970 [Chryseobacterium piperi]